MAQEEYLILHNMVVALYWAVHKGEITDLAHIEAHLKMAVEKSAGITLDEAEEFLSEEGPPACIGLGC